MHNLPENSEHESLQCPANSTRKDPGIGYSTFIKAVKEFKEIGITVSQFLDETKHDIENVLLENKASWHKSCRDHYNSTKLKRGKKKRKQADVEEEEKGCDAAGSETAQSSPIKSNRKSCDTPTTRTSSDSGKSSYSEEESVQCIQG